MVVLSHCFGADLRKSPSTLPIEKGEESSLGRRRSERQACFMSIEARRRDWFRFTKKEVKKLSGNQIHLAPATRHSSFLIQRISFESRRDLQLWTSNKTSPSIVHNFTSKRKACVRNMKSPSNHRYRSGGVTVQEL